MKSNGRPGYAQPEDETVTVSRRDVEEMLIFLRYLRQPTMGYPGEHGDPMPTPEDFARHHVKPDHARVALANAIHGATFVLARLKSIDPDPFSDLPNDA